MCYDLSLTLVCIIWLYLQKTYQYLYFYAVSITANNFFWQKAPYGYVAHIYKKYKNKKRIQCKLASLIIKFLVWIKQMGYTLIPVTLFLLTSCMACWNFKKGHKIHIYGHQHRFLRSWEKKNKLTLSDTRASAFYKEIQITLLRKSAVEWCVYPWKRINFQCIAGDSTKDMHSCKFFENYGFLWESSNWKLTFLQAMMSAVQT